MFSFHFCLSCSVLFLLSQRPQLPQTSCYRKVPVSHINIIHAPHFNIIYSVVALVSQEAPPILVKDACDWLKVLMIFVYCATMNRLCDLFMILESKV